MTTRRGAVLVVLLWGLAACGEDDLTTGPSADPAPPTVVDEPTTDGPTGGLTDGLLDGALPFDLGSGIVRGGDDVVADGIDVPSGRFVDEIDDRTAPTTAAAHRLEVEPAQEERVRAAAAEVLSDDPAEVDFHVDGSRFELHAEGHGHDAPRTTVAPSAGSVDHDEADAVQRTLDFVEDAGLGPIVGEPRTFVNGPDLSVEVDVGLLPDVTVTRAMVSLTFDRAGAITGGFGTIGTPSAAEEFAVVDIAAAIRRLELVHALSGHPTTTSASEGPPVALRSVELVLAVRDVLVEGMPTGDTWLVPTYRFVDAEGGSWEITAVVASALAIP